MDNGYLDFACLFRLHRVAELESLMRSLSDQVSKLTAAL